MYGIYKINAETSIMNESNYKDFNFPNLQKSCDFTTKSIMFFLEPI